MRVAVIGLGYVGTVSATCADSGRVPSRPGHDRHPPSQTQLQVFLLSAQSDHDASTRPCETNRNIYCDPTL